MGLLAQTKLPEDRKIWKEKRDKVFLSQPQYKQSIDHHRETTSSLSFNQTQRVPWSVLTILAEPSCHISVTILTYIIYKFKSHFLASLLDTCMNEEIENKTCNIKKTKKKKKRQKKKKKKKKKKVPALIPLL